MRGHAAKRGTRWYAVIFRGYDENGKRKYQWISGFNTKKEVEKYLAAKINEINNGLDISQSASKQTFGDFLDDWLAQKRSQVRAGTFRSYEWLIRKHVIPHLGHIVMTKLQPAHLQKLYVELQNISPPLSNRSILHAHRVIKQALDRAVKWGIVVRNVAEAVDAPRPQKAEIQVWNETELKSFLNACTGSRYKMAFLLAAATGVRLGELLALRWEDCDFGRGLLQIKRSYSYTGKGYKLEEPKTERGKRSIALPPSVVDELRRHRVRQSRERLKAGDLWTDHGLVICTSVGTPVLQHNLRMQFYKFVKLSGVKKIRVHDLRHTHATLMLKQGVHPKVVQERLGHSNIQVTLDTYSHVLPGLQEAAARQFDAFLYDSSSPKRISPSED